MQQFFSHDKQFYRTLIAVAIPITLQNLITIGISMMDTVMLGRLGEIQMTSVTLANQWYFIFNSFMYGLCAGSNVLIAQYWGKKDVAQIRKVMSIMYKIIVTLGILFGLVAFFMPRTIMTIFIKDTAVIESGIEYLRIIAFVYIFHGLTTGTVFSLRALGKVKIAVAVSATSLFTNTFLNWVFIFGMLGFPAMGVSGAAIATVIAKIVEYIIIFTYSRLAEKEIRFGLKDLFKSNKDLWKDYTQNVVPVICNEVLWGTGSATVTMVIGRMGTQFVAASSICSIVSQFVFAGISGIANATAIITGNTIGRGEYDKAKQQAHSLLIISIVVGIMSCGIILLIRPTIIEFYKISEVTKGYLHDILGVAAVVIIFQSFSVISMMGILRGGGDSKFVLFNDVFFMWAVAIPLGYVCGHILGLPIAVVYAFLKCDEMLKSIFSVRRVIKGQWVRDLTL